MIPGRDLTDLTGRSGLLNQVFSKGTLAITSAAALTFKTGAALEYSIDGVSYSKAAGTFSFAPTAALETQPAGQSRYYTAELDAAGNVTIKQGGANGPLPVPGSGYDNSKTYRPLTGVITAVTKAFPPLVSCTSHGLQTGDWIRIDGVVGMGDLNNQIYQVKRTSANDFSLPGVDATKFSGTYTSGGTWQEVRKARVAFGAIRIDTGTASFVPGTTALDAAGITTTYFDLAGPVPSVAYP
jgi:hypothetical protein